MNAPTIEQFLTQPEPEEDDFEHPAGGPLTSIAASLSALVGMVRASVEGEAEADRLREAHDDLDAKYAVLYDLLEEIESIIKPSTSKLANTVREAIDRWRGVEDQGPETPVEPQPLVVPGRDDSVEAWRDYARALGHDVVDTANRSQIRTLLGISQVEAGA